MKKFGKTICIVLLAAMVAALCACGQTGETDVESSTGETDGGSSEVLTMDGDHLVTVDFTAESVLDYELDEDGKLTSLTLAAGDSQLHFYARNVGLNGDGTLTMYGDSELLTNGGLTNFTAVLINSDAGLDNPISVYGLVETPEQDTTYGYDAMAGYMDPCAEGGALTVFGYVSQEAYFYYSPMETDCRVTGITFAYNDEAGDTPGNLECCYIPAFDTQAEYDAFAAREYGYDYSVVFDFSDESIIVDKKDDGVYLTELSLYNSVTGETVLFSCDRCRLQDGVLSIEEGGSMTLLTEMGGIGCVEAGLTASENNDVLVTSGYSPNADGKVHDPDEILWSVGGDISNEYTEQAVYFDGYPAYFKLETLPGCSCSVTSLTVHYDNVHVGLRSASLYTDFYGYYLEGDTYDATREQFSAKDGIFTFYLIVVPDSPYVDLINENSYGGVIYGVDMDLVTIGNIRSSDGTVKDRSEKLAVGDTLEVTIGDYALDVPLPVCAQLEAENLKDTAPADIAASQGTVNVLVVPFYFEDQADAAAPEKTEELYRYLGRVLSKDGTVTDYSDGTVSSSFSEYFDTASYGKLTVNSFVTDWYALPGTYAEHSGEQISGNEELFNGLVDWVNSTYSEMLPSLDQDGDGLYDAVVFLNAAPSEEADSYSIISYEGAYNSMLDYNYSRAITDGSGAGINHYTSVNLSFFEPQGEKTADTLIHEFSHQLGLIDYYDVYYTGINAVGNYDMQSDNQGDWNAFSKFAAGWISPTVVTESDIDNGITITINAFEQDGSTIVIPTSQTKVNADGTISPFSEYILIDLFTPDGLYAGSCGEYGLTKAGVRIYHVDARMLTINLTDENGKPYVVGSQLYTNAQNAANRYQVELIQAGGVNTLTDLSSPYLNPYISQNDLFKAGDTFSMNTHGTFFYNGLMDDGSALDYKVKVVSIENGTATITISR